MLNTLSLLIGISLGLFPFLTWKLILPLMINAEKVSKFLLLFAILIKFLLLLGLVYLTVQIKWLIMTFFIIGITLSPLGALGLVLTLHLSNRLPIGRRNK